MVYRIATALAAAGTVMMAAAATTGPAAASAAGYHSSPAAGGATVSLAAISGIPGKALVGRNRHTLTCSRRTRRANRPAREHVPRHGRRTP